MPRGDTANPWAVADQTKGGTVKGLLGTLLVVGLVLLVLGLIFKALKWLIIIAAVVWLFGLVRGVMAKRSGQL